MDNLHGLDWDGPGLSQKVNGLKAETLSQRGFLEGCVAAECMFAWVARPIDAAAYVHGITWEKWIAPRWFGWVARP